MKTEHIFLVGATSRPDSTSKEPGWDSGATSLEKGVTVFHM